MILFYRWKGAVLAMLLCLGTAISSAPIYADDSTHEDSLIDQYNTMIRDFRFGDAQNLLQNSIQSYPANPLFPLQLVSLQANIRAYVDLQQRIIDAERINSPGRALRAARRILEVRPEQKGAQEAVDSLGSKVTLDLRERLAAARAFLERGEIEKSREDLDALLSIDPGDPEVRALLRDIEAKGVVLALARQEEVADHLAHLETWAADRKRSAQAPKEDVRKFNAALAQGLAQNPGDPQLLAQARRGQELLRTAQAASADKASQKTLQETVSSHVENPEQLLERGRSLLGQGQFGEAEQLFSRLARLGSLRQIPLAYLYQGIARLASISASDVQGARQQRLRAVSSFQNALRFDAAIPLPAGYQKYARDLAEARQTL
jgi:tetratricopeptide (TPR) repeat protein